MTAPKRIQRQRTRGWRMPEGAVYVGRPTKWGNPWALNDPAIGTRPDGSAWDASDVVRWFRSGLVDAARISQKAFVESYFAPLRGRDLACWCPLSAPCHADVLLELANRGAA
jgi:hypothetical protein